MTDEKFILDFLDKNYKVEPHSTELMVKNISNDKFSSSIIFIEEFKNLFGDFQINSNPPKSSIQIYEEWYFAKKTEITSKYLEYFNQMDYEKGSALLLEAAQMYFTLGTSAFFEKFFNDFYSEEVLKPKLQKFVYNFDKDKASQFMVNEASKLLLRENPHQYKFAINFLNDWYSNAILNDKIKNLLKNFVITLGKTNWKITWTGNGLIGDHAQTEAKLKEIFKAENEVQMARLLNIYSDWYYDEVIEQGEQQLRLLIN